MTGRQAARHLPDFQMTISPMFHYFPNRRSYSSKQVAAGAAMLGITYYVLSEKAPYTNRRRLILTTSFVEQYTAEQAYKSVLSQTRHSLLSEYNSYHLKVAEIASKLLASNNTVVSPDLNWQVHVVNSNQLNAFVLANGKIFVYKGLFDLVQSDSELAAVISHELAHVVARHSAEGQSFASILAAVSVFLGFHLGGLNNILSTTYSRTLEHEADEIGIHLMAKACYDPNAAVTLWKRFGLMDKNREQIEFLSTHPTHKNREERIKSKIPLVGDWKKHCKSKWW